MLPEMAAWGVARILNIFHTLYLYCRPNWRVFGRMEITMKKKLFLIIMFIMQMALIPDCAFANDEDEDMQSDILAVSRSSTRYSSHELKKAYNAIAKDKKQVSRDESKKALIYDLKINENKSKVYVWVDSSVYQKYLSRYEELYGDMVHVYSGSPSGKNSDQEKKTNDFMLALVVFLIAGLVAQGTFILVAYNRCNRH